jgi:hypothetical protein
MTWSECEGGVQVPMNGLCHKCGRHSSQNCGRPLEDPRNIKIREQEKQIVNLQVHVRALCRGVDSLVDFGGTVGPSSSYWNDVWPEIDGEIERTRKALSAVTPKETP